MTANAPGTNHPLRKRTAKAWKRAEELAHRMMEREPSLTKGEAMERAVAEMRNNGRGDWRAG